MNKILVIQTAFLGDVILATGILEKLHHFYPKAQIDFVVRKGNHGLLDKHPFIKKLYVWNKQEKYKSLFAIITEVRKEKYDLCVNIQRFGASGFLTARSKAKTKIGFDKNPFSRFFDIKVGHEIGNGKHEIERNNDLIESLTDKEAFKPRLYPSKENLNKVLEFKTEPYVCIAPSSVWFTKQLPKEKWLELIPQIKEKIYLIGGPSDFDLAEEIKTESQHSNIENLSGKLNLLESVALIKDAKMNFVNDSGPMHMASSVNAPTTAIYCSTVPEFGFGPLSTESKVLNIKNLDCKPCGLHGHKSCPKGHFKCAKDLEFIF